MDAIDTPKILEFGPINLEIEIGSIKDNMILMIKTIQRNWGIIFSKDLAAFI
ncbi:hypothetical protein [Paraclostridium sp. AKS73]|uniref:hypothetical protein n=1 Tax=Paraclostridium sp. AKS73 TaxID=2876116 RepID=UPI002FCD0CD1